MYEKQGNSVSEVFAKGLEAMSEDKGSKFSTKSKEVKSAVAEGLS
jgi:hypothetical protein